MTSGQLWNRLRTVVQASAAIAAGEPKHLAAVRPPLDHALELLNQYPSRDSLEELEYLRGRVEEHVARWRPRGAGANYAMPDFAINLARETQEAKRLCAQLRAAEISATPVRELPALRPTTDFRKLPRPSMFIGSSVEGLHVAEHIQLGLDHNVECTIWDQGLFGLSRGTLESLVDATRSCDFAALVLTADDLVHKRGTTAASPRDNVILELGIFMGALGRERTFIVYCRDEPPALPSDLAGITVATYARRADGNLTAALGPVCTLLKEAIRKVRS